VKIRAVGTAGGKSSANRLTTFLVDGVLAVDAGSVCTGLSLEEQLEIQQVFISHVHMDHVGELPLLVDNLALYGRRLVVYATTESISFLKQNIFNGTIWPDFTQIQVNGQPALRFHPVSYFEPVQAGDYQLTALPVFHLAGSAGCHITRNGTGFVYSSDTGATDRIWAYVNERSDVQAVITECSFPADMEELAVLSRHFSSLSLAGELEKLNGTADVYIYHLKPQFADRIRAEIEHLPVRILHDNQVIQLT